MLKLLRSWTKRRVFLFYSESIYIFGTVSNPRKNTTWVTWLPNFQNFICVYYYKVWDLRVNLPKFLTKSLYKIFHHFHCIWLESSSPLKCFANLIFLIVDGKNVRKSTSLLAFTVGYEQSFLSAKSVASRRELREAPRVPRGTLASIFLFRKFFFFFTFWLTRRTSQKGGITRNIYSRNFSVLN